jgi:hypothetical protein
MSGQETRKKKHLRHRCRRCLEEFDCQNPSTCEAGPDVLPNVVRDGKVERHCPDAPDWDWIRARIERERGRQSAEAKPTTADVPELDITSDPEAMAAVESLQW